MSSESDYKGVETSSTSSDDPDSKPHVRPRSRRQSHAPLSPRKRRRDESDDPVRDRKRHLDGKYNNSYRILFNEDVNHATARIGLNEPYQYYAAQIGASTWTSTEKFKLFAALERIGKDNVPAIASTIKSKSIPEVRDFLLILQNASEKQGDAKVTLDDIPAAIEIGNECDSRLELAGDALAWYQERFEAKQEQERYGRYWLITPSIATEVEDAISGVRSRAASSSPVPVPVELVDEFGSQSNYAPAPQILQEVPEASLLNSDTMLTLSKHLFMNRSSSIPSPWPHWSELVSELASEPSIYRTAFNDFHHLVVSLTKRLMQVSIVQATSRLRAQRRRERKGILPYVKKRDVLSAIDILGMKRNGRDRWKGVARRCGVQVFEGRFDAHRKGKREVPWDEVERILSSLESSNEVPSTDAETTDFTSGPEDSGGFKDRAVRSGTPLPAISVAESDADIESDNDFKETTSNSNASADEASQFSVIPPTNLAYEAEVDQIEELDRFASRQQELKLWALLGEHPPSELKSTKIDQDEIEGAVSKDKITSQTDGWRSWTQYRAPWEEFRNPLAASQFLANQKPSDSSYMTLSQGLLGRDPDMANETGDSSSPNLRPEGMTRMGASTAEIPIRGARAYAALRERISVPGDTASEQYDSSDVVDDSDADPAAQSVENPASGDEEMDWDI